MADASRPAGARVLLVVDHLLGERELAATVLFGPTHAGPACLAQPTLPGAPLVQHGVFVARPPATTHSRELSGQLALQPARNLAPKGLVFLRESRVHGGIVSNSTRPKAPESAWHPSSKCLKPMGSGSRREMGDRGGPEAIQSPPWVTLHTTRIVS